MLLFGIKKAADFCACRIIRPVIPFYFFFTGAKVVEVCLISAPFFPIV